jgi:hypothetical protein
MGGVVKAITKPITSVAKSVLSVAMPSVPKPEIQAPIPVPTAVPAAANETIKGNELKAIAPTPTPMQDEYATATAKKKADAKNKQRGGVASTVLSDTLGG